MVRKISVSNNIIDDRQHFYENLEQWPESVVIFVQILLGFAAVVFVSGLISLISPPIQVAYNQQKAKQSLKIENPGEKNENCAFSCRFELVESIPQNLSFEGPFLRTTYSAWLSLINDSKRSIDIAAYKSSLQGKHVLLYDPTGQSNLSKPGETIYEALKEAGLQKNITIRMVENSPGKDKGDNEDGITLHSLGALKRRPLNMKKIFDSGVMHSKFIVVDNRHFYLGSANLDWRSLNQKMELGVLVQDCPCLAREVSSIFNVYWEVAKASSKEEFEEIVKQQPQGKFSASSPLKLKNVEMYLAASPKMLNQQNRNWDLDSIVDAIKNSRQKIYINVMDYFPMFLYGTNKGKLWPPIDNALREAILRGVHVKIIAAALHSPEVGLKFLKSLRVLGEIPNAGSVEVKIFKVPTLGKTQAVVRRDRRTHKKFVIADNTLIISTSNWSGDYFDGYGIGISIIMNQTNEELSKMSSMTKQLFYRDWNSPYAHTLDAYIEQCLEVTPGTETNEICERKKEKALIENLKLNVNSKNENVTA